MSQTMSRRAFGKQIAAAGTAAIAASTMGQAAKKPPTKKPTGAELMAEADLVSLESKLEKPLPTKLRGLAKTALQNARKSSAERRKFALPEGSEPCTMFVAAPARVTER